MNKPLVGNNSTNNVRVDVYTIIRQLSSLGIHVHCPKQSDQDKLIDLSVSIFDGLKMKRADSAKSN